MNRNIAKYISLVLALTTLSTIFSGCSKKENTGKTDPSPTAQSSSGNSVYPLKTNVTIKYWESMNGAVAAHFQTLGDTPFGKELMKKTGIKIEFIHPATGQGETAFNLMLASGDLPDIIEWNFDSINGGAENAIKQGYILKLNDVVDKYCPNLKQVLKSNPEYDKYMKTDAGSYYSFPQFRDPERPKFLLSTFGPLVRKDWLDELGLPVPTTIDEWGTMLKAFKDKKGAVAPLSFAGTNTGLRSNILDPGHFISDYVVTYNFYHDADIVKWGILDPKYKDAIQLLAKWYNEGLLDSNLFSTDATIQKSNILSGKTGASIGWAGSSQGVWLTAMKEKDPKFNLVAAPNPTLKKGDTPKYGKTSPMMDVMRGAITSKCKNIEIAARLLDYGYSKEGEMLFNYGIEGESYTMVNGKATFMDNVLKNPDKWPIAESMAKYIRGSYDGPFVQRSGVFDQFYEYTQQTDALNIWGKTDAQKYVLYGLSTTSEESAEMAKLQSDITTYHDEMATKFVLGVEPMANFSKFQDQLKKLGADRMLQLKQAQFNRLNKR